LAGETARVGRFPLDAGINCCISATLKEFSSCASRISLTLGIPATTVPAMSASQIWPRFSTRASVAWVVLCLFVLQASIVGFPRHIANEPHFAGSGMATAAVGGTCHAEGGESAPDQGRHDHSRCCIFCAAGTRDASLVFVFVIFDIAIGLAYETVASVNLSSPDDRIELPIGWNSTWSSRAPPAVA